MSTVFEIKFLGGMDTSGWELSTFGKRCHGKRRNSSRRVIHRYRMRGHGHSGTGINDLDFPSKSAAGFVDPTVQVLSSKGQESYFGLYIII